jgi:2-amino-4-hydroxy-6-hydroxymethyldihydropteridine diphosphokinase
MKYYLSLGSNLEIRGKNLNQAISLLEDESVEIIQSSSVYETQPVDFPSQPWFYNQVTEIETGRDPQDLLALVKRIEQKMGRIPQVQKGPRIIDIDILLAEDKVIYTKELKIPHPSLDRRNFVLIPFSEIAPETVHPILNQTIQSILEKSSDHSVVRKVEN